MRADRVAGLFGIGISVVFWGLSFTYPPASVNYPRFILTLFFLLSAVVVFAPQRAKARDDGGCSGAVLSREKIVTTLLFVAYVALIGLLGFFVSTLAFTLLYLWIMEPKGLVRYLLFTAVFLSITYFVFGKLFYVNFPQGLLF